MNIVLICYLVKAGSL